MRRRDSALQRNEMLYQLRANLPETRRERLDSARSTSQNFYHPLTAHRSRALSRPSSADIQSSGRDDARDAAANPESFRNVALPLQRCHRLSIAVCLQVIIARFVEGIACSRGSLLE